MSRTRDIYLINNNKKTMKTQLAILINVIVFNDDKTINGEEYFPRFQ